MVVHLLPKQETRVRFPHLAPLLRRGSPFRCHFEMNSKQHLLSLKLGYCLVCNKGVLTSFISDHCVRAHENLYYLLTMFHIPKNYLHDRFVLLLLTINGFVAALLSILILLRLDSTKADSYIVQYRSNLGVNEFQSGGGATFISFILFALMILVLNTILSMRIYSVHRQFALVILGLGLLLLVMALFVSNALLVQR